jgi:hypothetical protein
MGQGFRQFIYVSLGALLSAIGVLVMLVPVPLPFIGVFMLLSGFTLLITHSRKARRWIQRARHRSALLSRTLERFAERAPAGIRLTLQRTRPEAIARYLQISALNAALRAD